MHYSDVLLTVDFDRTFSACDSTVPQRNLDAVRYFMEQGGTFTINTGRSAVNFAKHLTDTPVNAPFLLYNGSAAYENGIETTVVPGPTAFSCALVLSGLTVKRFSFEGFLSMNKNSRSEHLSSLKNEERTMVFYEAPHKLKSTLKDLQSAFSDGRRISIVKEITKLHESVFRGTIGEAVAYFEENEPRGEYVLVVDGKTQEKREYTLEEAVEEAKKLVSEGISKTDASKTAAKLYGFKKSDIYKELN